MTQFPNNDSRAGRVHALGDDLVRPGSPPTPTPSRPRADVVVMSADQAEDLTRRLTTASMALRRGETLDARRQSEELAQAYPQAAAAHELLGDVLAALGDHPGAIRAYRQALAVEPGRPTAEIKLGRSAIRTTEMGRRAKIEVAYPGMEILAGEEDRKRAGRMALIASLIIPGLGQMLTGRMVLGAVLAAVYLIDWLIIGFLPETKAAFEGVFGVHHHETGGIGVVVFFLAVQLGVWIYAMVDASRNAGDAGPTV